MDDELTAMREGGIDVADTPAEGVPPSTLAALRDDPDFAEHRFEHAGLHRAKPASKPGNALETRRGGR